MKNRKIIQRIYTKEAGIWVYKTMYLSSADFTGQKIFSQNIDDAILFREDDTYLKHTAEGLHSGSDRTGDFSFTQKIIDIKLTVEND